MLDVIAGRYRIDNCIGQGGMADVYLAYDEILKRYVALKVLRSKAAEDPTVIVRFFREASAASKLSHPNIVDIYDVGEDGEIHYMAMEYIRGSTLKKLLQLRGALDVRESISIIEQLCQAVREAHINNIVHRDIKPQNIMVRGDGTIKITDFGIAVAHRDVSLTHNEAIMGSAQYLAPETTLRAAPSPSLDIYSIGIVFFELLAGTPPFTGGTPPEIALAHLSQPLPSLREINPNIPVSVENIVRKATAKDPAERYQSVTDILRDLDGVLSEERMNEEPIVLKTETIDFNRKPEEQKEETREPLPEKPSPVSRRARVAFIVLSLLIIILSFSLYWIHRDPDAGLLGFKTFPALEGMSVSQAVDILEDNGFTADQIDIAWQISDSVPRNHVISSSIRAGTLASSSDSVELVLSKGESFLIEDFTGRDYQSVMEELEAAGIEADIILEEISSQEVRSGIVLEQQPAAGTRVDPEEMLELHLGISGDPTFVIPMEVLGMDVDEAKELLNSMGAAVSVQDYYGTQSVQVIDPAAGTEYTQEGSNSVITLYH